MSECRGRGDCLRQTGYGYNTYELNGCPHKCSAVKCPNFLICDSIVPQWILGCNKGTCTSCGYTFGTKLTFYESVECPICLEDKPGVKQVNCDHKVCIDCFKRCHYGSDNIPQPVFPYPREIEDEYDNDPDDSKWINDPLIIKYNEECIARENKCDETYYREASLRICGICRK
jgi:hypothetical protein